MSCKHLPFHLPSLYGGFFLLGSVRNTDFRLDMLSVETCHFAYLVQPITASEQGAVVLSEIVAVVYPVLKYNVFLLLTSYYCRRHIIVDVFV